MRLFAPVLFGGLGGGSCGGEFTARGLTEGLLTVKFPACGLFSLGVAISLFDGRAAALAAGRAAVLAAGRTVGLGVGFIGGRTAALAAGRAADLTAVATPCADGGSTLRPYQAVRPVADEILPSRLDERLADEGGVFRVIIYLEIMMTFINKFRMIIYLKLMG